MIALSLEKSTEPFFHQLIFSSIGFVWFPSVHDLNYHLHYESGGLSYQNLIVPVCDCTDIFW